MPSTPWRKVLIVGGIAVVHYLGTFALLLLVGGAAMHTFDTGAPASLVERIGGPVLRLLMFPALVLPTSWAPGLWGHAILFMTSVLWAVVIYALARILIGWRQRRIYPRPERSAARDSKDGAEP